MATVIVPTSQTSEFYSQQTTLDGQLYTLQFKWNRREESWYLDILTDLEDPIQYGIKIVCDWPLGRLQQDPRMPPGLLMAVDTSGLQVSPTIDDLGTRVLLVYVEEADL